MKILFLCNKVPYPPKDGGSIATLGMIRAFARAGHETTVIAMNTLKHKVVLSEIPQELKSAINFNLVDVPASITFQGLLKNLLFSSLPYNAERFISKSFSSKLKETLQNNYFDIIQLEGLYLMSYISEIRKYSAAKVVYRSHNIEHEIWERTLQNSSFLKRPYLKLLTSRLKKFETASVSQYDLLVAITKRDLDKMNQLGNTKPSIEIPAGVSVDASIVESSNFEQNLFFIGALDWTPNQEGLIWFFENCWNNILESKPDAKLKIAGRNAPKWFIQKIRKEPNILFEGEVENAHKFMQANGVMIAPLLSGSGMRVKIIEGMLHRKAIVTTSVGCEGIQVENEKQLFFSDNPIQFAQFCLQLLSNKTQLIRTGNTAFEFVCEQYNNHKLHNKLFEFYKQHLA